MQQNYYMMATVVWMKKQELTHYLSAYLSQFLTLMFLPLQNRQVCKYIYLQNTAVMLGSAAVPLEQPNKSNISFSDLVYVKKKIELRLLRKTTI